MGRPDEFCRGASALLRAEQLDAHVVHRRAVYPNVAVVQDFHVLLEGFGDGRGVLEDDVGVVRAALLVHGACSRRDPPRDPGIFLQDLGAEPDRFNVAVGSEPLFQVLLGGGFGQVADENRPVQRLVFQLS